MEYSNTVKLINGELVSVNQNGEILGRLNPVAASKLKEGDRVNLKKDVIFIK